MSVDYGSISGGYTALIRASRMQHVEVVRMLLDAKADPNKSVQRRRRRKEEGEGLKEGVEP